MAMRTCALASFIAGSNAQLVMDWAKLGHEEKIDHVPGHKLEEVPDTHIISTSKLCDATVQQHNGYVAFQSVWPEGSKKAYFFWMFEAREVDPKTAPFVIWLTGGPGCSSQLALLAENGPCTVSADGSNTTQNPYSWHQKANVMWVDQPAGTGFSLGMELDGSMATVSADFYNFLENFYTALPQYKNNPLYITGESYAGHYVPAIANYVWTAGKKGGGPFKIPLKGIAIGNGLTDPEVQYQWYPEMAFDGGKKYGGTLKEGVITNVFAQGAMKAALPGCIDLIKGCDDGWSVSCATAFTVCNLAETSPYQVTGMNVYDMRIKCEKPPLCYDFSNVDTFLNDPSTQKTLGVDVKWESCNMLVNKVFMDDFMREYSDKIPPMLEDGIDVLIYAGDVDYICNWLGNRAWTLGLNWSGQEGFTNAENKDYMVGGKAAGKLRRYQNFHFMQVYQAGHMVPMNQPVVASQMLNEFLAGAWKKAPEADGVLV